MNHNSPIQCQIDGCERRSVRGYSVHLCPAHRQLVVDDIMSTGLGDRRCYWPGCRAHCPGDLRICNSHMTLVVDHARTRPAMKWNLVHLENFHWTPAPEPPTEAATEPTAGTVYFLRVGGYVKIGWTSNLEKRMKGYAPDSQLLAVMPGTRKDERRIHKRFAHLLTRGREWFPLAPQITEYVQSVKAEHGEPPTVDFSAKAKRLVGAGRQYIGGPNRGALAPRTVRG